MKTLNLVQGTPEWHQHRATARNASDAPAMMGVSPYKTRQQLIEQRATGIAPEVDPATQARFDRGHQIEELARPFAEQVIADDLYPVIGCSDDEYLSASFDGLTMDGATSWECKSQNAGKAMAVEVGDIPDADLWQCVQQLLVSGAEKLLYTLSDGTYEGTIHCWFTREQAEPYFAQLIAGWKQFDEDVANYVHVEQKPEAVAAPVEDLPAIFVQVSGALEIQDNFKIFEERLRTFLDNDLVREPQTDDDFATLDQQIKALKKAEEALESAEKQMLAQVVTVDQAKRTKEMLAKLVRDNRLMAEKLLKAEKDNRRNEIQLEGAKEMSAHIERINATLGDRIRMPAIKTDFVGVMKGKRTIASLRDAMETELARGKVEASMVADKIRLNLETLRTEAAGYESLFADAQQLVLKENDDVKNVIALRIREHKDAEEKRLAAEREKIRAEERAAAELRVQQEREEQERKQREDQAKADAEEKRRAAEQEASEHKEQNPAQERKPVSIPDHTNAPEPTSPSGESVSPMEEDFYAITEILSEGLDLLVAEKMRTEAGAKAANRISKAIQQMIYELNDEAASKAA